jgi:hypothetical protein
LLRTQKVERDQGGPNRQFCPGINQSILFNRKFGYFLSYGRTDGAP